MSRPVFVERGIGKRGIGCKAKQNPQVIQMNSIDLLLGCFSDHIPFAWYPTEKKKQKPSTSKALPIWQKSQLPHQKSHNTVIYPFWVPSGLNLP